MIKVDIVSGFLGAGKTSLIKKLIELYQGEKLVLIENEFGEIAIDGDLIEQEGMTVYEISSGCICCLMEKSFKETLTQVLETLQPDRILIEPTGISILSDIIKTIEGPAFKSYMTINSLVTVVDAVNYLDQADLFGAFFDDQIAHAWHLLISKSQLVDGAYLEVIRRSLKERNQGAAIISQSWDQINQESWQKLLEKPLDRMMEEAMDLKDRPCQEGLFKTHPIFSDQCFTFEGLEAILKQISLDDEMSLVRAKGLVKSFHGGLEFSLANKEISIRPWDQVTRGKACFIGTKLNVGLLDRLFDNKVLGGPYEGHFQMQE